MRAWWLENQDLSRRSANEALAMAKGKAKGDSESKGKGKVKDTVSEYDQWVAEQEALIAEAHARIFKGKGLGKPPGPGGKQLRPRG